MPGIDRTTIISGPALITFGGQSFWSKGDIAVKPTKKRFNIETSAFGKIREAASDFQIDVTFEPAGQFSTALAAVLFPYAATAIGASIYGATDRPLVVHSRDGQKMTIHNAALTQMPNIRLGVDKTTLGPIKFTGLLAKSTDPTNAAAYFTNAAVAYPGDTGFDPAQIFTLAPAATWGASAPWLAFATEAGWEISFDLKLSPQMVDGLGTVDMTLQSIDVSAKATPVGPSVAQAMTALETNAGLGTAITSANSLFISNATAGSPAVTLSRAALVDVDLGYGSQRKRLGPCEWIATRNFAAGTATPLFTIAQAV